MEIDEREFKELVHRHKDLIWRICSSYRLSAAWTTEDAFHEVLCDLWRGFGKFGGLSSERTWVFRVATNKMISLSRKNSNQPTPDPSQQYEPHYREEGYRDLLGLIEALPEPDGTIVRAYVQGFKYAEIAQITGLSVGAVSMRLSRALRKIRKLLEQD